MVAFGGNKKRAWQIDGSEADKREQLTELSLAKEFIITP